MYKWKIKKMNNKLDKKISFRQMNNYITSGKELSYTFSAFLLENMKKGKQIEMKMELNLGKDTFISRIAECVLNEEVSGASKEKQIPADFNCSIKDLENINKIEGLILISCEEISGIPKEPNMTNPIEIDKLIKIGEIKDYSLKENKNIIPPIFREYSLDTLGCKSTGVFKIKGKLDKPAKHFRFNLPLSYPFIDIRCDVPDSNGGEEVIVTCKTKSKFSSSNIIIEASTISYNSSEVILLFPISSNNKVSCQDFSTSFLKKTEKKYKAPFSFRQVQDYKNNNGRITFSLFIFKTEYYKNENSIKLKGKLTKNSKLRLLEELPLKVNIDCSSLSTKDDLVKFECSLNGDPLSDGVIILDCDQLSGIPLNVSISNPAITDSLIKDGKTKDCNFQDCSLATFNNGKLICNNCYEGIINLQGKINGDINDGSIFHLNIFPESFGDCIINITKNNIECFNKEEIEDNKIIIPEETIRDENNTELFRLKRVISDTNDISIPINLNLHSKESSNIPPIAPTISDALSNPSDNIKFPEETKSSDTSLMNPSDITHIIPNTSESENNDTSITKFHFNRKKAKKDYQEES